MDRRRWRPTAAADGYTAARDALKDALYARDGVEPLMRRNRTEVPIPPAAERTPERLMELLTQEIPSQVDRRLQALQKARGQDERDDKPYAVTAWCIDTAHTIVSNRAEPWNTDTETDFIPWTKPDPRAGDDFFLTCWSPHELDELAELRHAADVPRTMLGILQALTPDERPRAWAEMTSATHGPDLDRAMACWWHAAMNMGTAAMGLLVARFQKRQAAGERGTPSTDIASSRALDDLLADLTPRSEPPGTRSTLAPSASRPTSAKPARTPISLTWNASSVTPGSNATSATRSTNNARPSTPYAAASHRRRTSIGIRRSPRLTP